MDKEISYTFTEQFLPEMMVLVIDRIKRSHTDVFEIVKRMGSQVAFLDAVSEMSMTVCKECGESHGDANPIATGLAVRNFYLDLALLVKFMYPIMEQLQATVDHNTVSVHERPI